jgi:hypothetical protein
MYGKIKEILEKIRNKRALIKKQRACKHEDITIIASDSDYAVLYCYDCKKQWVERC